MFCSLCVSNNHLLKFRAYNSVINMLQMIHVKWKCLIFFARSLFDNLDKQKPEISSFALTKEMSNIYLIAYFIELYPNYSKMGNFLQLDILRIHLPVHIMWVCITIFLLLEFPEVSLDSPCHEESSDIFNVLNLAFGESSAGLHKHLITFNYSSPYFKNVLSLLLHLEHIHYFFLHILPNDCPVLLQDA